MSMAMYVSPDCERIELISPAIDELQVADRPGVMPYIQLLFLDGEDTTTGITFNRDHFFRVRFKREGPFFLHLRGHSP
jgi:hypothetical protein